jgi:hypothetical protein
MSEPQMSEDPLRELSREQIMSALFEHMVVQNTNMALMFLGQMPHPQSGESVHDIQAARIFIDQLEMLEFKTRGNLSREEEKLLQQGLMHLRLAFVEAVEHPPNAEQGTERSSATAQSSSPPEAKTEPQDSAEATADAESRKRCSKKY